MTRSPLPIRVFVYGTLKRGEPNHQVMTDTPGQQKFIGVGITETKFPLVVASKYNIPFLLADTGKGNVSFAFEVTFFGDSYYIITLKYAKNEGQIKSSLTKQFFTYAQIKGEVYEIDETKLEHLDVLEAYPTFYDRKVMKIGLEEDGNTVTDAWVYMLKKWREDILSISSELLTEYSTNGPHNRQYVSRYLRAKDMLHEGDGGYNLYDEVLGIDNAQDTRELTRQKALNDLRTSVKPSQ